MFLCRHHFIYRKNLQEPTGKAIWRNENSIADPISESHLVSAWSQVQPRVLLATPNPVVLSTVFGGLFWPAMNTWGAKRIYG